MVLKMPVSPHGIDAGQARRNALCPTGLLLTNGAFVKYVFSILPLFVTFAVTVIVISAEAMPPPPPMLPPVKEGYTCFFPQAPPTIENGAMRIYGCQQIYSDTPVQCCLYTSEESCALLCNDPRGKTPLAFQGSAVPCPGFPDQPDAPIQTL